MKRMLHLSLLFFLSLGLALSTAPGASAAQSMQVPLNPKTIPQFVDPLPNPYLIQAGAGQIVLNMNEFQYQVLSTNTPLPGLGAGVVVGPTTGLTWVWGYQQDIQNSTPSYIGPVILATRDTPTEIKFVNNLGSVSTTKVEFYKYSVDQTLHWADPLYAEYNACAQGIGSFIISAGHTYPNYNTTCANNYAGPIPAVVHLHGGEVPPVLDGGPDAWFTSGTGEYKGHGFHSKDGIAATNYAIYRYPNSQEAAPIWFHDHALGITRINVYAGLAGAYLINDPNLGLPTGLRPYGLTSTTNDTSPTGDTPIVPLVIQDRMFDNMGQLFFPGDSAGGVLWSTNPDHPYWVPEFVGDTIVVNGKTWPFQNVQAKRYRFLFLNGSNARTYELALINQVTGSNGPPMWVIGTDGGYLDAPAKIDPALGQKLVIMPGERYDVIIDFSAFPNATLLMRNTGRTPYPKGAPPNGSTLGRIIQFRVGIAPSVPDTSFNPATPGATLRPAPMVRLPGTPKGAPITPGTNVQKFRQLTLNEDLALAITVANDPVTNGALAYPGGPLEVLVNNSKWMGKFSTGECRSDFVALAAGGYTQCYSELPNEGETELWEIINLTADAHPMHLHAVQFQIVNRQNFNFNKYNTLYNASFPAVTNDPVCTGAVYCPGYGPPLDYNTGAGNHLTYGKPILGGNPDVTNWLQGTAIPPALQEQGWKDTVVVPPGMVTRLMVRWTPQDAESFTFDPNGGHGYVWHCHIIDHEDNEMMRPTSIKSSGAQRTYSKCSSPTSDPNQNCY